MREDPPELHDVEGRSALHRLAPSDLVVLRAVRWRPTSRAFRDVSHHGFRCTNELVGALSVAFRKGVDDVADEREELDGTLVDVEALEGQH